MTAARARGRRGGRPPKLGAEQIELARHLDQGGHHTVAQIATMLNVLRTTIYGHLTKQSGAVAEHPTFRLPRPLSGHRRHGPARPVGTNRPPGPRPRTNAPTSPSPRCTRTRIVPGTLCTPSHCRHCEPGQPAFDTARSVRVRGDGPILAGALAEAAETSGVLPDAVRRQLARTGWHTPRHWFSVGAPSAAKRAIDILNATDFARSIHRDFFP